MICIPGSELFDFQDPKFDGKITKVVSRWFFFWGGGVDSTTTKLMATTDFFFLLMASVARNGAQLTKTCQISYMFGLLWGEVPESRAGIVGIAGRMGQTKWMENHSQAQLRTHIIS